MKQLVEDKRSGELILADVPPPFVKDNGVLVQNAVSLLMSELSSGGKSPQGVGGSSSGTVVAVGRNVNNVQIGDRVACYSYGNAIHAELIHISNTQLLLIPEKVSFQEAAFLYPSILCLSAMKTASVGMGSSVFIFGLDMVGQLLCQILRACGCYVLACDAREEYIEKVQQYDIHTIMMDKNFLRNLKDTLKNIPLDAVFFSPIIANVQKHLGNISKGAKVVFFRSINDLKHRAGLSYHIIDVNQPFLKERSEKWDNALLKELKMLFRMVVKKNIDLSGLVSHRFSLLDAHKAYKLVSGHFNQTHLGVVLTYPQGSYEWENRVNLEKKTEESTGLNGLNLGIIHTSDVSKFCIFDKLRGFEHLNLRTVAATTGMRSLELGKAYHFDYCTTNPNEVFLDREVRALMMLNRGKDDYELCIRAIEAQKDLFIENFMVPDKDCLNELIQLFQDMKARQNIFPKMMLGFYRRYTAIACKLRGIFIDRKISLVVHARCTFPVDEGPDAMDSHLRLILEFLHWVDFFQYLVGSDPMLLGAMHVSDPGVGISTHIKFRDGSLVNLYILACPSMLEASERVEIFCENKRVVMEDLKTLDFYHEKKRIMRYRKREQTGPLEQVEYFLSKNRHIEKLAPEIGDFIVNQMAGFALKEALQTGRLVEIKP